MNGSDENPFQSPRAAAVADSRPEQRRYPWSIIRAQFACVALSIGQFGESYVNRYDGDGIHEMMLYGGVATLVTGALLAIPDWRVMLLPFLYFTVVAACTFFLWLGTSSSTYLTFTFHSGSLQTSYGLAILFWTGSVSARRYYMPGAHESSALSPSRWNVSGRAFTASFLFMALSLFHLGASLFLIEAAPALQGCVALGLSFVVLIPWQFTRMMGLQLALLAVLGPLILIVGDPYLPWQTVYILLGPLPLYIAIGVMLTVEDLTTGGLDHDTT